MKVLPAQRDAHASSDHRRLVPVIRQREATYFACRISQQLLESLVRRLCTDAQSLVLHAMHRQHDPRQLDVLQRQHLAVVRVPDDGEVIALFRVAFLVRQGFIVGRQMFVPVVLEGFEGVPLLHSRLGVFGIDGVVGRRAEAEFEDVRAPYEDSVGPVEVVGDHVRFKLGAVFGAIEGKSEGASVEQDGPYLLTKGNEGSGVP